MRKHLICGLAPVIVVVLLLVGVTVLVTVQSGRTYRVRAFHEVWNAGVYESDWSVTPGAFVP